MGAALLELEIKLRATQSLTLDESRVLDAYKVKALKDLTHGFFLGGSLTFLATWKLKASLQMTLSCAASLFYGWRKFSRSLDSCVKDIVAQDGTRMQLELTNILMHEYPTNSWVRQVISKHFYTEKVYDDSTSDQPKLRLRYRSYFNDNVVHGQKTHDLDDDNDEIAPNNSREDSNNSVHSGSIGKKVALVSRQAPITFHVALRLKTVDNLGVNAGLSTITDPIDDIFGFPETLEESNPSSTPTKVHGRSHKRSRRRRRREASMEPVDA